MEPNIDKNIKQIENIKFDIKNNKLQSKILLSLCSDNNTDYNKNNFTQIKNINNQKP